MGYFLSMAGCIACKDASPFEAFSCPSTLSSTFDKLREIERRARQEIADGRRGKGYIFGAFRPATGEACTQPYAGRTIANGVEFLERVDAWVSQEAEAISAILDNLNVHRATDVLLFSDSIGFSGKMPSC
jgi:hypothetical protein